MSSRLRPAVVYVAVPAALLLLWAWKTGYLFPEPSLDPNPLAIVRGEAVFKGRCFQCHEAIPIAPRVAGWTPEYAYDAIGHLPELRPAMPPFKGTDQERADLAVYLVSVGAHVPADQLLRPEEDEDGWEPPRFGDGAAEQPQGAEAGPAER